MLESNKYTNKNLERGLKEMNKTTDVLIRQD